MALLRLSQTNEWKLEFPDDQDVRGYHALNQDGSELGATVADLIIDTDQKQVTSIVLSDGAEYPARDISIGDGVVYVTGHYPANETRARRASEIDNFGAVVACV